MGDTALDLYLHSSAVSHTLCMDRFSLQASGDILRPCSDSITLPARWFCGAAALVSWHAWRLCTERLHALLYHIRCVKATQRSTCPFIYFLFRQVLSLFLFLFLCLYNSSTHLILSKLIECSTDLLIIITPMFTGELGNAAALLEGVECH